MNDLTDSLEEIQTEHKDLLKIALGKKISKIESIKKNHPTSLPIAPLRKSQTQVNLDKSNLEYGRR